MDLQAKLSHFSAKCKDLLVESLCLAHEVTTLDDLLAAFDALNTALGVFLTVTNASCNAQKASNGKHRLPDQCGEADEFNESPSPLPVLAEDFGGIEKLESDSGSEKPCSAPLKLRIRLKTGKRSLPNKRSRASIKRHPMNESRKRACARKMPSVAVPNATRSISNAKSCRARLPKFCPQCNAQFKHGSNLYRHLKQAHSEVLKVACSRCDYETVCKETLHRHIQTCQRLMEKKRKRVLVKEAAIARYLRWRSKKIYQCAVCGQTRPFKSRLLTHMISHKEPDFLCEICSLRLKDSFQFKQHLLSHSAELNVVCHLCGYRTWCDSRLKSHMSCHKERSLKCEHIGCTQIFKTKSSYMKHVRYVHEKVQSIACERCNRLFVTQYEVDRHMLTHTGEKSHCCHICGRAFGRKYQVLDHLRRVHKLQTNAKSQMPILPNSSIPQPPLDTSLLNAAISFAGTSSVCIQGNAPICAVSSSTNQIAPTRFESSASEITPLPNVALLVPSSDDLPAFYAGAAFEPTADYQYQTFLPPPDSWR